MTPWRLAWTRCANLAWTTAALWAAAANPAFAIDWPTDPRLSGNTFLTPGLQSLQNDPASSPIGLWLDRGKLAWADAGQGPSCQSCHGTPDTLRLAATHYPQLTADGQQLINLEDRIIQCRTRSGATGSKLEDADVLALSALLHEAGKGQPFNVQPSPQHAAAWQTRLGNGARLYATRMGRINLACVHCHDQKIGAQMRADVVSPGNPTGFPIYRMSWQSMGSIDRRLRACFSGVQATVPPAGDPMLRDLELFLKTRASGLLLDGPSVRR